MTSQETSIRIPGLLEQVAVACEFVGNAAQQAGLDERAVYHCQLAVDEVCTNIVEHGYLFKGSNQVIDIVCRADYHTFTITILDDSPPFDPLNRPAPDPKAPLEERTTGGWGVYFVKKLMDDVRYQWIGRNQLVMVKRHGNPTTP
ncbi:MAG: ATP-binding protein [Anaerolineae bacterium]|nr:ATP-binding protein [Anaerolineae bacterium]